MRSGARAVHLESTGELAAARGADAGTALAMRANTTTGVEAPLDNMVGGPSRFGLDEELLTDLAGRRDLAGAPAFIRWAGGAGVWPLPHRCGGCAGSPRC
ncbi:hypothetical protein GCM10027199_83570 [Amycolatopsis magusensis]